MASALTVARRGLGRTSPNPSVGAVVTRQDETGEIIIARAVTGDGGTPHAEPQALEAAGAASKGATLYVTLEPCNHHGRTPPCTEAIIKAGIAHVVIASQDPDPRVAGSGIAKLEQAGIRVTSGVRQAEADRLNSGHITLKTKARPYIIIKSAVGSDNRIAPGDDTGIDNNDGKNNDNLRGPRWVTSKLARRRGHLLRAEADAILIGRQTAATDNPSLTCRLKGLEHRSPRPVILDTRLTLSASLRIFQGEENSLTPLIICSNNASQADRAAYATRRAELLPLPTDANGHIDLKALVKALAEQGITRLLVEGGPQTAASFIDAGLFDQLNIFKGTDPAGEGSRLPFGDKPLEWGTSQPGLSLQHSQRLKGNIMYQYIKS